ncbi:hypothetical protein BDY21DRAFT_335495 [Lineolata rhizophorae]|uniref:Cora-like Mg2+ transporter protein-domain-containing protein n=1 Tax=Lineolata rhizophorae TaxID=578093 RepID=A0A6A6P8Y8_9PEZI|nr:hypothetical protein BDY21DRAFT_335495 [Lineolata rhizophorae]
MPTRTGTLPPGDKATGALPRYHSIKELEDMGRRLDLILYDLADFNRRLHCEESVLYNLISQRDNQTNIQLAASSRDVAEATRSDSRAMKTISMMTLVFLPATFVSSVFSTTVFDFQNWGTDDRVASSAWWVYFLVCVLLTVITFSIWYVWTTHYIRKERRTYRLDRPLKIAHGIP